MNVTSLERSALLAAIKVLDACPAAQATEVLQLVSASNPDAARKAALDGNGRELELKRLAEEELEREKEKRIEQVKNMAVRRILLKDLARGWTGWHGMWSEKVRQRNLLKQAGARLTKPKLVAAYSHWIKDWNAEMSSLANMTQDEKVVALEIKLEEAQSDMRHAALEAEKK